MTKEGEKTTKFKVNSGNFCVLQFTSFLNVFLAIDNKLFLFSWKKIRSEKKFPFDCVPARRCPLVGEARSFSIAFVFSAKTIGRWDILWRTMQLSWAVDKFKIENGVVKTSSCLSIKYQNNQLLFTFKTSLKIKMFFEKFKKICAV